jgi:hypothetical protein
MGLLGYGEMKTTTIKKYSFWKWVIKSKLPPRNYLHFWIKIGDFGLKECILKEKSKSLTSGRKR